MYHLYVCTNFNRKFAETESSCGIWPSWSHAPTDTRERWISTRFRLGDSKDENIFYLVADPQRYRKIALIFVLQTITKSFGHYRTHYQEGGVRGDVGSGKP